MSAARSYLPLNDDLLPPPDAADLAAGIVSPLDIPVGKPIPYLRMKRRHYRVQRLKRAAYQSLIKRHGRAPWVSKEERQLRKLKRVRSSVGLPVSEDATLFKRARKLQDMDEELLVSKNHVSGCTCGACYHQRNWSGRLQQYNCLNRHCRIQFDSFQDMFEHHLDVHGILDPRSGRVVDDLFHQQRGTLAFPPSTVYAGQQFLVPSRPPTRWKSMKELDQEAKTLQKRLVANNRNNWALPWKLFDWACKLVKKHGEKEMERQYQVAMEHFYSAYKFPASSRGFHDGCPSVERGRNWLTSTEREDLRLFHPFSLNDKALVEPEFVLIDTKRDQEMLIELSDDSDDEDDQTSSRGEAIKVDDDEAEISDSYDYVEEEKVSEDDTVKSEAGDDASDMDEVEEKARVDEIASDSSDDEMGVKEDFASDSSVEETQVNSDADESDDDVVIKSEVQDSHSDSSTSSESDVDRTVSDREEEDEAPATQAANTSDSEEEPATQVHASNADSTASGSEASSDEDEQDSEIFNQLE